MNSNILDVIITLCFTYLLLALIVTTVGEIINTMTKNRSKLLQEALKSLFDNITPATKGVVSPVFDRISKNPFITILKGKGDKFPSYIPPNNISLAVMDLLNPAKVELTYEKLKELINNNSILSHDKNLRNLLLTLLNNSKGNVDNFILGVENTFNDCMERATGWFKRRAQIMSFIISLILVVALKVDTIQITNSLWSDKNTLDNAVGLATNFVNNSKGNTDDIKVNTGESTTESPLKIINSQVDSIKGTVIQIQEMKLPIGWEKTPNGFFGIFIMIIGMLISTFAVYLGAPFWFDILKRFVHIRGTGKKPSDKTVENNYVEKTYRE
ncbi:MAG: hypothetical protein ABI840_06900 [bacterium]